MDFIEKLKQQFRQGNILMKLIYINIGVFVMVHLISVVLMLFNIDNGSWLTFIELPSQPAVFLRRFWTLFTYMFVHYDVWHILFNMLWLYWFGQIFLQYFGARQLGGLYLLGGIAGGLLYLLSYNIFPYFAARQGMMCGASAAIMAIVLATAMRAPDYKVNLMFIGAVSLKYIAGITILIDLLSMSTPNAGGHIAHIGGAIMGIIYVSYWNKGRDLTRSINHFIDRITTRIKYPHIRIKRSKKSNNTTTYERTTHQRPESDSEYNARKKREMDEIDHILDKIKKSGYSALTEEEKKRLFEAGKKH